ncbi:MAG: transglutaminase family protein [Candidatus Magnetobacterium sp. LHC-1]|nr:transglutaminase family protein [Nitrospirota bacterium]
MAESLISRRNFLIGCLAGAGALCLGRGNCHAGGANDAQVKSLTLKIRYTTEFMRCPKDEDIGIWLPIPPDDKEQEITALTLQSRLPFKKHDKQPNKVFYCKSRNMPKGERITLSYTIRRTNIGTTENNDDDPKQYLIPSEWEKWDDNITQYVDTTIGKATEPVVIARKLCDGIIQRTAYLPKVCTRGVSTLAFEEKSGRNDDFNAMLRSMLMYKGIAVKWQQGMMLPYPSEMKQTGEIEADCINAHSWLMVHVGNGKWMPVDVSEAKQRPDLKDFYLGNLVPNRIRMSTGRGLTLEPPQQEILNTFAYTHAEANGIPLIYGHNYKNFIQYELLKLEK